MRPNVLLVCVLACALHCHWAGAQPAPEQPKAARSQEQQPAQPAQQQHQPQPKLSAPNSASGPAAGPNSALQAHLSAMQAQAQRQLGQLNGLVLSGASQLVASAAPLAAHAVNLTGQAANKYGNVLEALANVGKAIQHQIMHNAANNPNAVQIVTAAGTSGSSAADVAGNSKKNEYQSIVVNEGQQLVVGQSSAASSSVASPNTASGNNSVSLREQSELLRGEIMRRAGQLQQVVTSSMDILKNNGDLIVRRLLEQLNHRLDQAKSKADRIISEPATNEMALKALGTINQGLNNLNNIINNIVNRLDLSAKESQQLAAAGAPQRSAGPNLSPLLIDPNRLKMNLQQLGQQFSSALNANQRSQWSPAGQAQQAPQQQPSTAKVS